MRREISSVQLLRIVLGIGSLVMLLTGLRLALQPQTVAVHEVKTGINQLVEDGAFKMQPVKPVTPALVLSWSGVLGLSVSLLVSEPAPLQKSAVTSSVTSDDDRTSVTVNRSRSQDNTPLNAHALQRYSLTDFWLQGVSFSKLTASLDLSARIRLLDNAIAAHEHSWIDRLLCCPCLLVIARPASGKSSFAAALAMCRELLLPTLKLTIAVDPNANLKVDKGIWQAHWRLVGAGDNWEAVGTEIATMYRRFADSKGQNFVSSIYDELTAYDGNVNASQLGGLLPQITSKARDSEEYIILVSHNDTLKCLGGQPGEAKLKNDMVQLNLGSKSAARGKLVPTGTGTIEGLDFDEKNKPVTQAITLPRWFDPVYLAQLFPEVYQQTANNSEHDPKHPLPQRQVSGPNTLSGNGGSPLRSQGSDNPENHPEFRPLPPSLPTGNHSGTEDGNGGTAYAARLAAARSLQERIQGDLAAELELSALLTAMEALVMGQSDSHIIKEVLGLKGRNYDLGKTMLQLIKESIRPPES